MSFSEYPFFIHLQVTEKCNLQCRSCYRERGLRGDLFFEEIASFLGKMARVIQYWDSHYRVRTSARIYFTGGEPLLREDVFQLLDLARNLDFSTSLLTNGTLVTPETANRLVSCGVEDVQVSLDGTGHTHDGLRGKGSFEKAVQGIRALVEQGLDTHINVTVSSMNYSEIDDLFELAGELGVSAVGFSRLVICGRGENLYNSLLSPGQLLEVSRKIKEGTGIEGPVLISRDPLLNVMNMDTDQTAPGLDFPVGGCSAGVFGIAISNDGAIMPCRRMGLPIGNILTDDFRQLWVMSPVLADLRDREKYNGSCRTCRNWAICRGCRAIALANARSYGLEDYLGPDPQCDFYRRSAG